jgi:hypothetical protein
MDCLLVATTLTSQELGRLLSHSAASQPEPAFHVFPSLVKEQRLVKNGIFACRVRDRVRFS